MFDLIKAIILGIVEGVTEFLPISSTGHLIVAIALLKPTFNTATFLIFIQFGAVIAVIAFYRAEIWKQVTTVRTDHAVQHFWITILIAFIPVSIIGLILRSFIKQHLDNNSAVVAVALIIGGILFIVLERYFLRRKTATSETSSMMVVSYRQALLIGFAQTIALIPGVSRSAASIFGGMLSGLNRETATRFSFYLAIPTLGAATVDDLLLSLKDLHGSDLVYLAVGTIVTGIIAWFAVGWLLRYIAHHNFTNFGYYRIVAGVIILVLVAAAVL